ncbi:MAG: sigma-70 family RNA polymerase sigma factor, partial [Bacteroidia bacterium]|nr:sigma-70 family RNA polymerase sigma factor [Bacteroidia bacterium]
QSQKMNFKVPRNFLEKGETNVAMARFQRISLAFSRRLRFVGSGEILNFILSGLPQRERRILALRYMENRTLKEIGEDLGITDARVFQIHAQAIKSIERHFKDLSKKETPGEMLVVVG